MKHNSFEAQNSKAAPRLAQPPPHLGNAVYVPLELAPNLQHSVHLDYNKARISRPYAPRGHIVQKSEHLRLIYLSIVEYTIPSVSILSFLLSSEKRSPSLSSIRLAMSLAAAKWFASIAIVGGW